jgi:hypothetical protein
MSDETEAYAAIEDYVAMSQKVVAKLMKEKRGPEPEPTTEERLEKMRLSLKTLKAEEKAANQQHRNPSGTGQFVKPAVPHAATQHVYAMRQHLIRDHGISPVVAGSMIGPSLEIQHSSVHASSSADHDIGDVSQ